ncbi:hypothetical protein HD806DRAFT_544398 [Xylariaceae sp. AK1471]|nr:hypothetical protein HD806DRAFT_544398 [Xylariaceae sp. AK1471]
MLQAAVSYPIQLALVWLSPDNDPAMHKITGVGRSAHAENDDLHVITTNVGPDMPDMRQHPGFLDAVYSCLDRPDTADQELEYRLCGKGAMLVPRLRPSKGINQAIGSDDVFILEVDSHPFGNCSRPSSTSIENFEDPKGPLFLKDVDLFAKPLGSKEIQIDAISMALSKLYTSFPIEVYTGSVILIGSSVHAFAPDARVAALGSTA